MSANQKASDFLKELCANIDFSVPGYRPSLKEPLILASLSPFAVTKLKNLGCGIDSTELKVSTQRQLFHGLRQNKQDIGKALSKDEFLAMPLNFTENNLYVGFDKYNQPVINFFWGEGEIINYAYFGTDMELRTYGKTNKKTIFINRAIKISQQ